MRFKIITLTIVTVFVGALSVYFVFEDLESRKSNKSVVTTFGASAKTTEASAFILPVIESTYLPLRDWNVLEPEVKSKAAIVYDTHSGKILFQKNVKTPLPIASITKLLTAMIVLDNNFNPNEEIAITAESVNADGEGGADFYLNEKFYLKDLVTAMLVKSSNDAASALDIFLKQNNIDTIQAINQKVKEIGMLNSVFYDFAGLDDKGKSTAEDIIILIRFALKYPEIQNALLSKSVTINSADGKFSHNLETTNKLLGKIPDIEGGKTGYTDAALGTMVLRVGLPEFDSSIVAVVLGTSDRFGEIQNLIEWSKRAYKW